MTGMTTESENLVMEPPPAMLTLAEIARELRISIRQTHRMLASGQLYPADAAFGSLRCRRWRRDRFMAWLEAGCPSADAWEAIPA